MNTYIVTKYNVDGTEEIQSINEYPSSGFLKNLMNGYLEIYERDEEDPDDMYVDEEGLLKDLKPNKVYQDVVGPVIRVHKIC